jgi:hypothetical protein
LDSHKHTKDSLQSAQLHSEDEVWSVANNILERFQHRGAMFQLISLIDPIAWQKDNHWRIYHKKIRFLTSHPESVARRLHVVSASDLGNKERFVEIFNLMLAEYLCRIRSRLLSVSKDIFKSVSSQWGTLYQINDFSLFDCATITSSDGQYGIIFSDIKPYFEDSSPTFSIFSFPRKREYIYYFLRANFYRGWHNINPYSLFSLPALFVRNREGFDIKSIIDCNRISSFIPGRVKLPPTLNADLITILEHVASRYMEEEKPETIEQLLEQMLAPMVKKIQLE